MAAPGAFSSLHDFVPAPHSSISSNILRGPFPDPQRLKLLCFFIGLYIYFRL